MSNTSQTLTTGTILYHGTDADFDEENEDLCGPAWLSNSANVAKHFAARKSGWGGIKRIISYRLCEPVALVEIGSKTELADFADQHGLSLYSCEDIRDSVATSALPGWIIPFNYPEGADILMADTRVLRHVRTETV